MAICTTSYTTPWPAMAASPWITMGTTFLASKAWSCSMMARAMPCITGVTLSRWLGLGLRVSCTSFFALVTTRLL